MNDVFKVYDNFSDEYFSNKEKMNNDVINYFIMHKTTWK